MRMMVAHSLVWGAFFVSGLVAPSKPSGAANCALYARAETGVALFGAAGGWWDEADGRYQRGHTPQVGAILVFRRTSRIPSGHVAVVTQVVGANEIMVDHANWYRGRVNRGMSVIDTSPGHDWTSVAVVDLSSGKPGRDYPSYGFIYPGASPRQILEASSTEPSNAYIAESWQSLDAAGRPVFSHAAYADEPQVDSDLALSASGVWHHRRASARHTHRALAQARALTYAHARAHHRA